ncbi:MAG TPA: hypothetical protein DDX03_08755 [Firmicutes bacterium]|nr:hypothetical protein [Bacillota bacterium]
MMKAISRMQMTRKHTITILLALLLCLTAAGPVYGMEQQQRTIQAFRLLKNMGLIQALPASDEDLMSLDRFEKANIVAQAAERAVGAGAGAGAGEAQLQQYPAAVLESLAWLESVFYEELIQLNKTPRFLALSGEGARDMGAGSNASGSNASVANLQVPIQAEMHSVYVDSSSVRTWQMIITEAETGAEEDTGTEADIDHSAAINVPIMF